MKRQEMLKFKIEVTTVTKENLVFEGVSVCNKTWLPVVYQKKTHKCWYFSLMSQISRMLAVLLFVNQAYESSRGFGDNMCFADWQ